MKVQDVAIFEQSNRTTILLVREGLFWRAYGRSAQLFCTHLRSFQVKRRTVKAGGDRSAALTASLRSPTAQDISHPPKISHPPYGVALTRLLPIRNPSHGAQRPAYWLTHARHLAHRLSVSAPLFAHFAVPMPADLDSQMSDR